MYVGEIEFPLFTEAKWKEKDQIKKKNKTGSPAPLMSPKTCTPQSSQQASHYNSASLRVVSQPMTFQKGMEDITTSSF